MAGDLQNLTKQRDSLRARWSSFEKILKSIMSDSEKDKRLNAEKIIELEMKVERQEGLFKQFDNIQGLIETHDDIILAQVEEQFRIREEYESKHDSLLSKAKAVITRYREFEIEQFDSDAEHTNSNASSGSVKSKSNYSRSKSVMSANHQTQVGNGNIVSNPPESHHSRQNIISSSKHKTNVELPRIKLPTFSGSYEKWPEFRDTFLSLVNNRDDLDPIEKYHYLRLHLDGEAKQTIEAISFSAQNYNLAWELLCDNYNNQNLLVYSHLKQLVGIPKMISSSAAGLRNLSNQMSKHLNALKEMKLPTDEWGVLVIFLMCEKLDKKTEQAWEEFNKGDILPTLSDFKKFLKGKADTLEKIENRESFNAKKPIDTVRTTTSRVKTQPSAQRAFATFQIKCGLCKCDHYITNCNEFLKLSTNDRVAKCKANKLCLNCLKSNHLSKDCRAGSCRKCNGRHHTLLHFERSYSSGSGNSGGNSGVEAGPNNSSTIPNSDIADSNNMLNQQTSNCYFVPTDNVLLSTAVVTVRDCKGNSHNIRAILDSGSQSNFIVEETCNKLGLKKSKVDISIVGITQVASEIKHKCEIQIKSIHNDYQATITCLVIPRISDKMPSHPINVKTLEIPNHIRLADAGFNTPGKIDLLVGAELFYSLLCVGQISLGNQTPILQKTVLGWVVSGPIHSQSASKSRCNLATIDMQRQLEKFWLLEKSTNTEPRWSKDEELCENIFQKTTTRDIDGKFVIDLPFRQPPQILGNSERIVKNRFKSLENKLSKNPALKSRNVESMDEYERLGHMSRMNDISREKVYYFLPHHGVLNENSETTKLRVEFDASCTSDNGISLNDILLVGPTIQDELFSIILRFRQHRIVVCADVEKMYRMVKVNPIHWPLQCIFWRRDPDDEISIYNLTTVTYGTASAPFSAVRCLQQLAQDRSQIDPTASNAILRDFYVDDFISGANTVDEAIQLSTTVSSILKEASFNLRKWSSNSQTVLARMNTEKLSMSKYQLGEKSNMKLLGLFWSCEHDILTYSVKSTKIQTITKRFMLSEVSQIFDPLGLLTPCTMLSKLMLQRLWTLKLTWDEAIPMNLSSQWRQFREQLNDFNLVEIPRRIICNDPVNIQLHGYANASQDAYGASVYIRSRDSRGESNIVLLCAKSKVAPLKTKTINKLELCGALLLARLTKKVISSMSCTFDKIFLWLDSSVVLCWINDFPHLLQQLVANQVSEIQMLTNVSDWNHVRTHCNPADLISRGINPNKIAENTLWWNGPEWLRFDEADWPRSSIPVLEEIPDLKTKVRSFTSTTTNLFPFERFSNFVRLKRTFAWCKRFSYNCKNPKNYLTGPLKVQELADAALCLATLRRFVSRRGKPHDIYLTLSDDGLNWHFIPGYSPHFGGLWEAGVKSTKHHLKRVLGEAHLTFEEFYTVLVQIEAILNSRPLTPLSSDPNDLNVLTPAHFLIGRRLTSAPDNDYSTVPTNRLSRFQLLQKLQQDFWTRWSKEFIGELQTRSKWNKTQGQLEKDTLVLIREDNLPPSRWRLGRVESLIPGPDGITRVANIKTANGVIKRSFSKLCPLVSNEQ